MLCVVLGMLLGVSAGGGSALQILHVQDPPERITVTDHAIHTRTVTVTHQGKGQSVTGQRTTVTEKVTVPGSPTVITLPASTVTSTVTTTETTPASTPPTT